MKTKSARVHMAKDKLSAEASSQIQQQLHDLQTRSTTATSPDELAGLLDETRSLLKSTFQTEFDPPARDLFRDLRMRSASTLMAPSADADPDAGADSAGDPIARRIRTERLRVAAGELADLESVVENIHSLLIELAQTGGEAKHRLAALGVLESVLRLSPALLPRIQDLFEAAGLVAEPAIQSFLERWRPAPRAESQAVERTIRTVSEESQVAQQLAQARRLIYAGDYYEAIEALTALLQRDPDNQEARERLAQVEDNLRRGIVPDSRVPFEARAAYGRAQSLERAGRFEEAREAYLLSLDTARAGGELLQNWQPAVEAILRTDNSILASKLREEADAALRNDQWADAVDKYEIVLRVLPDDGHARERLHSLRALQERSEVVQTHLKLKTEDLIEVSQGVIDLRKSIQALRPLTPNSQRLAALEAETMVQAHSLKERMLDRGQQLLTQARYLPNVSGSRRLTAGASRLLEQTRSLAPGDSQVAELAASAKGELARLELAEHELTEARRLVTQNNRSSRLQARDLLLRLQEYNQEPVYLQLLSALHAQYLEEARSALQRGQLDLADESLADATQDLFASLTSSEEVWRLEQELAAARRKPWLTILAWGGAVVVVGVLLVGLWQVLVNTDLAAGPAATATLAPSPTPIAVVAATLEPTPTFTATLAPSQTPHPTATPLPTATLAPTATTPVRFGAVNINTNARLLPNGGAAWAFSLRANDPVQILEETVDPLGHVWYKVLYVRDDAVLIGWARATEINAAKTVAPP